jgi:hypothetical protein
MNEHFDILKAVPMASPKPKVYNPFPSVRNLLNIMNKKIILISAITVLLTGSIGTLIYVKTRPEPVSMCDYLLGKMLDAKTFAERSYAEHRWTEACIKNQP